MLTRLLDFLDKNIIYKHHFGFQKNKLTTQAVFDLYTRIVGMLDKGNYACSVFLVDIEKYYFVMDRNSEQFSYFIFNTFATRGM